MITKESLISERESSEIALLQLKQKFKPNSNELYLIVEGKDDFAYYTCVFERYRQFTDYVIIIARNRAKVIDTYDAVNRSIYPANRILFFIDRDLSDFTMEHTPNADNIYVTDDYSIENMLFTERLFFKTLQVFYNLNDLNEKEIETISRLYKDAKIQFEQIFLGIMGLILYWRINKKNCYLDNIKNEKIIEIRNGILALKPEYRDRDDLVKYIAEECKAPYEGYDFKVYEKMILEKGGTRRIIRGKYVRSFFIQYLDSIIDDFSLIFKLRKKPKSSVPIGEKNALSILCGYMQTPQSLEHFLLKHMAS